MALDPAGVVGLGMVGKAVTRALTSAGATVHGYDRHQGVGTAADLAGCRVVFLCVPTPSLPGDGFDLTEVWSSVREIEPVLGEGSIVAVKSTVPAGTVDQLATSFPRLEFAALPEFPVATRPDETFTRPDRVIVGTRSAEVTRTLVAILGELSPGAPAVVVRPVEAELAKLCSNALLAAKVTMVNELSDVCAQSGASWPRVQALVGLDHRIGADHLTVTAETRIRRSVSAQGPRRSHRGRSRPHRSAADRDSGLQPARPGESRYERQRRDQLPSGPCDADGAPTVTALVTGGAGFIGAHLVDALLAAGHDVRVVDDQSTGSLDSLPPQVEAVEGSVADERVVQAVVRGVDVVFHQAAHRAVQRSVEHPLTTDEANTRGTLTLLKACADAGVRRLVYASSSSVYGGTATMPTVETAKPDPRSPYAVSKLAGEHYCRVFAQLYPIETVALRYFNAYGPRQRPDSAYATVVPLFIQALLDGGAVSIHGDGRQSRDFSYIDDVVRANLAAAAAPASVCSGRAYNIAGGARHSLLEVLDILAGVIGTTPLPTFTEPRAGDVRHTWADIGAAQRDLGHAPLVRLREGLARTVRSFAVEPRRAAV